MRIYKDSTSKTGLIPDCIESPNEMNSNWIIEFTHGGFSLVDASVVSECEITDEGIASRAIMHEDYEGITVFSPRYGRFAYLRIDLIDARPNMNFDEWDHVVELYLCTLGGLEISTTCGSKVIDPDSGKKIPSDFDLESGIYQLYVLFGNLAKMESNLRESNESGSGYSELFYGCSETPDYESLKSYDHYRIMLWPLKPKIVKRLN
jgi:hypothetical protein